MVLIDGSKGRHSASASIPRQQLRGRLGERHVVGGERPKSRMRSIVERFSELIQKLFGVDRTEARKVAERFVEHFPASGKINEKRVDEFLQFLEDQNVGLKNEETHFFKYIIEKIDWDRLPEEFKDNPGKLFIEFLNGAYFIIDDDGKSYEDWKKLKGANSRRSSRESDAKQYAFRGNLVKELLFSRKQLKDKTLTWFQAERYPAKHKWLLHHFITYLMYKATGLNQGPLGSSEHREGHKPITLHLKTGLSVARP